MWGSTMDEETAHVILDAQADIIALRAAMKMLLRQTYGIGDQALGVVREEALAGVENGLDGDEPVIASRRASWKYRSRSIRWPAANPNAVRREPHDKDLQRPVSLRGELGSIDTWRSDFEQGWRRAFPSLLGRAKSADTASRDWPKRRPERRLTCRPLAAGWAQKALAPSSCSPA